VGRQADNRRYSHQRQLLIMLMGSKCHYCPERRPWELEFHHTVKVKWYPAKTSRHRRIKLWMLDYCEGRLVLACGTCNKRQGVPPLPKGETEEPIPF